MAPTLNLFYAEPDPDRWLPLDRYPRRVVRRIVRGRPRPGGQKLVFLNLRRGLDRLGVPYRVNDWKHQRRHPAELSCVLGKRFLLDAAPWEGPLLVGPAVLDHPLDDPRLFERLPVRRLVVPGEWMRRMCEPAYGDRVHAWPAGIDTDAWAPAPDAEKDIDVLVYDKITWRREELESTLVAPVHAALARRGLRVATLRYGSYREQEYRALLRRARSMVFLCRHETQGIGYQQALASGVPLLAWEGSGTWQDPDYYPHRVRFAPVSAVPYFDERCGMRFQSASELPERLDEFLAALAGGLFAPRDYVLENLTLERCALEYVRHAEAAQRGEGGGATPAPAGSPAGAVQGAGA